jgi:hypothetical protein
VGPTAAVVTETVASAVEQAQQREREDQKERARQESSRCCATKQYDESKHSWRCTAYDDQ